MLTPCLLQMHTLTKMVVKDSKTAVANLTRDRRLTADAAADIADLLEDATEDSTEISDAIGIKTGAELPLRVAGKGRKLAGTNVDTNDNSRCTL